MWLTVACACDGQGRAKPASTRPPSEPRSEAVEPSSRARADDDAAREPAAFRERISERDALVRELAEQGIQDEAVLAAIRRVPRHAFVARKWQPQAYANHPLPIPGGQTISQPYIVAFMTEAVRPTPSSSCLEVGTGSGYQAAVLTELCHRTYSIEYLPEVARFGEQNLRALGYGPPRLSLRTGDGYRGWPEHAPFDVIVVTAAPLEVPKPLLDQLALAGRLIIPVGDSPAQQLELWTRIAPGDGRSAFRKQLLLPVRFVPFLGAAEREQTRPRPEP